MSKKNLSWIFAMILLALVPAVYAQSWTQGIGFVVINALVVGIVLFVLQSFLIPNKEGKEKTAIWVVIAVTSLLISWFYGRGGFIWNTGPLAKFFNVYLLVNALVIGTFLYVVLGLMGLKEKLGSKEGTTGYIILLFIVSVMFAFQLGNQWIWSQTTVARFIDSLFGTDGILNPNPPLYRLWVFLSSAVLLSFFFAGYLLKGGVNGKNGVSYALAIVLAASMASQGASLGAVIQLGELVFTILFFQTVNETFGKDNQIIAGFVSISLVAWASAAATASIPEYRGLLGSMFCKTGLIECTQLAAQSAAATGVFGWIKTLGMWILIIIAVIVVLLYKAFKGGGEDKKKWLTILAVLAILGIILLPGWIFIPFLIFMAIIGLIVWGMSRGEKNSRIFTLGLGGLKKKLSTIFTNAKLYRDVPEGREPQIFKENKHMFQALANYVTRSEINYRYWAFIKTGIKLGNQLAPKIGKFNDPKKLRKDIIYYRSGGTVIEGNRPIKVEGWNRLNLEAVNLMNRFYYLISMAYIAAEYNLKATNQYHTEAAEFVAIEVAARELLEKMKRNHEQYKRRLDAYGNHHVLKVYRDITLDMSNPTGEVEQHPQIFARPGAAFDMGNQDPAVKNNVAKADQFGVGEELNQYGEVVADIIGQKAKDPREYKKPRRIVNPEDIINFPDFIQFMENISKDWKGLAEDVRYGLHHPKSRTLGAYITAYREHKYYPEWADELIKPTGSPTQEDPAIDYRAMADPGKNIYWGRKNYYDGSEGIPRDNPYPNLCSLGLTKYLKLRVELDIKDHHKVEEFLYKYPADSGVPEKKMPGQPIGIHLSDKPPEPAQGG